MYVTNNYTPYAGGVVSSINAVTDQLLKNGHDVRIVTLDFLGKQHNDPNYVFRVPCPIKFTYKQNYIAVPFRPYHHLYTYVQKYKPDIIHVHHPFLLGRTGLAVAKKLSIPVVFTYHTMYEHYVHYVPFIQSLSRIIVEKLVLNFCRQVDAIAVPSHAIVRYLQQKKITTPKTILPSPLQTIFVTDTFEPKVRTNIFKLLIVSRFAKEKNIPFLLDLMTQLPAHIHLTLVGYGSEYESLRSYAYDRLQLGNRVDFVLKPSKDTLAMYYKKADLFVFSSQTDTQGLVLAEAMAAGTPVIALHGPGQEDIVKNGVNGFLVDNADHMKSRIMALEKSPALYNNLAQGAWRTAKNYYPERIFEQFEGLYSNISFPGNVLF